MMAQGNIYVIYPWLDFYSLSRIIKEQRKHIHSSFSGNSTVVLVVTDMGFRLALAVSTNGRFQPGGEGP